MRLPPRLLSRLTWTGVRAPQRAVRRRRTTDGAWLTCAAPVLGTVTRPGLLVTFLLVLALATSALGGILTRSGLLGQGAGDPLAIFPSTLKAWLRADRGVFTDAAADLDGANQSFTRADEAAVRVGTSWAFAFWFYADDAIQEDILAKWGGGSNEWIIYWTGGAIAFYGSAGATPWVSAVTVGAWHLCVVWRDADDGKVYIDIDGSGSPISGTNDVAAAPGASSLRFGDRDSTGTPFDGRLQGVAMLRDRIFSASERTALYNAGAGVSYSGLPATLLAEDASDFHYWPLCESTGTRNDQHGTAHLTAVNAPGVAAGPLEIDVAAEEIGNCPVKRIGDQSGNAVHFSQATLSLQPLYVLNVQNGKPVLRFDGIASTLGATIGGAATPLFVAAVVDGDGTGPAQAILDIQTGRTVASFATGVGGDVGWYDGAYVNSGAPPTTGWQTLMWALAAAGGEAFRDGVSIGTGTYTEAALDNAAGLGSFYGGGGSHFAGDIGEVVIVPAVTTAPQRAALQSYLKSRWNTP